MKQANETTRNAFLVIKPGNEVNVTWLGEDDWDREPSLEMLQKAVEGYIEVVMVNGDPNMAVVVNDEGILKGMSMNSAASIFAGYFFLFGNAIVMHRDGDKLLPLTAGEADKVNLSVAMTALYEKFGSGGGTDGSRA